MSVAGAGQPAAVDHRVTGLESVLVERARRGDRQAFEHLYRQHAGRVNGLCLRMVRDPDLAEDCVQDAFIRAWKALPKFEARSTFGTWIHRIAVNVVLERRRSPVEKEMPVEDTAGYSEPLVFDSPLETAELEAVVASLPTGARDVLVLYGIYGYDHAEAATMLGIAVGTCKAQLHRARRLVRERLEQGWRKQADE